MPACAPWLAAQARELVRVLPTAQPVIMMGTVWMALARVTLTSVFSIEMFHRGIETAIVYLEELARLPQQLDTAAALSV